MPEWLRDWWMVFAFFAPLCLGVAGWAIRMGLASKSDLTREADQRLGMMSDLDKRVSGQLTSLDRRMLEMETEIRHLPTAEDFTHLSAGVAKIAASIESTRSEVQTLGRGLSRIEDHLLSGKS